LCELAQALAALGETADKRRASAPPCLRFAYRDTPCRATAAGLLHCNGARAGALARRWCARTQARSRFQQKTPRNPGFFAMAQMMQRITRKGSLIA
jgi:hypothetical protein